MLALDKKDLFNLNNYNILISPSSHTSSVLYPSHPMHKSFNGTTENMNAQLPYSNSPKSTSEKIETMSTFSNSKPIDRRLTAMSQPAPQRRLQPSSREQDSPKNIESLKPNSREQDSPKNLESFLSPQGSPSTLPRLLTQPDEDAQPSYKDLLAKNGVISRRPADPFSPGLSSRRSTLPPNFSVTPVSSPVV